MKESNKQVALIAAVMWNVHRPNGSLQNIENCSERFLAWLEDEKETDRNHNENHP
jgi:hypothetical protein